MKKSTITVGAVASAVIIAGTGTALAAQSAPAFVPAADAAAVEQIAEGESLAGYVDVANVEGTFSFDQTTVSDNAAIAGTFRKATQIMCGAREQQSAATVDGWQIEVSGDVANGYTATLTEAARAADPVQKFMTCTCSNNLPGGTAIATALVEGISVGDLFMQAQPAADVNTVTFTATDGTVLALPLDYVIGHGSTLVYSANGAALAESFGGVNQLWIEGAAGRSFIRDIVSVEFTAEADAPEVPQMVETDFEYVNRPNVSISL